APRRTGSHSSRCHSSSRIHSRMARAGLWPPQGPHANARLRADARRRDGRVRQELAAGGGAMTNHDEEPAPLPALGWAVVFTILLGAAVAMFVLVLIR